MPTAVGRNLAYRRIASLCSALALFALIGFQGQSALAETGRPVDAPSGKFVINLMSTLDAQAPVSFASAATASGQRIYSTTVEIDGRTWYRIRLGFFTTKAEAAAALSGLSDDYPDAWIARVSDRESEMFAREVATADSVKPESAGTAPVAASAAAPVRADQQPGREPESLADSHAADSESLPKSQGMEATSIESRDPLQNLVRRQDERRPDDQFQGFLFDRPITIGGKYEVSPEYRDNYNLDSTDDRNLTRVNQEFRLEMLYKYSPGLIIFLEPQLVHTWDRRNDREDESELELRRGQSWFYYAFWPDAGLALQVGRQNLQERRSWWWDADLDAARLHFSSPTVLAELGIAREVFPVTLDDDILADQEDVTRGFGRWDWQWASRQHLEFFWLSERDRSGSPEEGVPVLEDVVDARDAELDWLGARLIGRWKRKPLGTLFYWADLAGVRGNETLTDFSETTDGLFLPGESRQVDVRGWGVDAGVTLRPRKNRQLNFTASYAMGSGDDGADSTLDRSFRQTGLNSNKDNYRGVTRFRYYGELLRPELSNLKVMTFAVGRRFMSASSVDLVYRNFRQVYANPLLRAARIRAPLNGVDKDVGDEIDLVIGIEEWRNWELSIVGSVFFPGDAYGPTADERAYRADLRVRYIF
jgi:hypothetical protein